MTRAQQMSHMVMAAAIVIGSTDEHLESLKEEFRREAATFDASSAGRRAFLLAAKLLEVAG